MATYVPNADDLTQPTEDKELVTAAAEFRALKAKVESNQTRIDTLGSGLQVVAGEYLATAPVNMANFGISNLANATTGDQAVNLAQVAGLIGGASTGLIAILVDEQTATAGQTVFNLTVFQYIINSNNLAVYVNGIRQDNGTAYVETDVDTVTFLEPLVAGDFVQFYKNEATTSVADPILRADLLTPAASKGAEMVAFNTAQNVSQKLSESVSVDDKGAEPSPANSRTAIQLAVDDWTATPLKRGAVVFRPGVEYAIDGEILVDQRNLKFSGDNAVIKWAGTNAAESIFHVIDSSRCTWEDLILLGDLDNPPFAAFYFESPLPARNLGVNVNHVIERCVLGRRWVRDTPTGGNVDAAPAGRLQNGIVMGGAQDGNNAELIVRSVQIHNCTGQAVDLRNTQSIWTSFENTYFLFNNGGIKARSNFSGYNMAFNRNATQDIWLAADIEVQIYGYQSENAVRYVRSQNSGSLFIKGGDAIRTVSSGAADQQIIRFENGGTLALEDLTTVNISGYLESIYYKCGSIKMGRVFVRNCTLQGGSERRYWEIDTSDSAALLPHVIDIECNGDFVFKTTQPYADRAVTPPLVAAGASGMVPSGSVRNPLGRFQNVSYSLDLQGQHLTSAPENTAQVRARIWNVTANPITLAAGRMRWLDLGDQICSVGSADYDAPYLENGTGVTTTITVPGVRLGDFVAFSADASYITHITTAYVSADNTVALRIHNQSGGNSNLGLTKLRAAKIKEFGRFFGSVAYAPSAIASGATITLAVDVPGAQLGGHTFVSYTADLQGLTVTGHVSSAGVVTIVASNFTGSAVTLAAGSFRAMVAF